MTAAAQRVFLTVIPGFADIPADAFALLIRFYHGIFDRDTAGDDVGPLCDNFDALCLRLRRRLAFHFRNKFLFARFVRLNHLRVEDDVLGIRICISEGAQDLRRVQGVRYGGLRCDSEHRPKLRKLLRIFFLYCTARGNMALFGRFCLRSIPDTEHRPDLCDFFS